MSIADLPLPYRLERSRNGPVSIAEIAPDRLILSGTSNYDRPAQEFADQIAIMTDGAFMDETQQYIWLSAYASNNPTSDYHWQVSACYYEAHRRGAPKLYQRAYDQALKSAGH